MQGELGQIKSDIAYSMGLTVAELGDPFLPGRKLPRQIRFWCKKHQIWWASQDHIACPGCMEDLRDGSYRAH